MSFADLTKLAEVCPPFGEDELKSFREMMSAVEPTLNEIVERLHEIYATRDKNFNSNDS